MATSARRPRRLLVGLAPLALVAGALPLLAPTCGGTGEGRRTFSRNSIIIPMDRCYQYQTDGVSSTSQPATCPQPMDAGDVIKAYGLVYQLIRNDVAVYWVIEGTKVKADAEDFHIQYDGGFPAFLYDWSTGGSGGAPTNQHVITYRGGPFVVDGSDYARASAVLQQYRTSFSTVNVHVANVAFQGWVKKVMAGGWSAGGTEPPKLALLDIGSGNLRSNGTVGDPKNAEPVIAGYLSRAGIGSGTAAGTGSGPHGEIYDKLGVDDFQPATGSTDWRTSNFGRNGYQILWVPHWLAAGSCSNYTTSTNCTNTLYSTEKTDQVLETIGAFVAAGGDLFAECAGIGSFEGTFTRTSSQNSTSYTYDYPAPCDDAATPAIELCDPTTRFQTNTGVRYSVDGNEVSYTTPIRFNAAAPADPVDQSPNFASPLLQLGDFTFKPVMGAIDVFRPNYGVGSPAGAYLPGVSRLIAAQAPNATWDYFTMRPGVTGTRGTVVYLGGHSYSGVQGGFQIGGTRLVLNTLFNLGAGCTESGVACDTGGLGVCAAGRLTCDGDVAVCEQINPELPEEICNGLDDDCNGLVDEDLEDTCYDGPPGTENVGLCRAGVSQCQRNPDGSYGMSACLGSVTPTGEVCNGLDDDCDDTIDQLSEPCYDGPSQTWDQETNQPKGACKAGVRSCPNGSWGACAGQVLPRPEACTEGGETAEDEDCNGLIDDANCVCSPGQEAVCYSGATGTAGVGTCRAGLQTCTASGWSSCVGEQTPQAEVCSNPGDDPEDEDCDGQEDEGCACRTGEFEDCYTGPAGTANVGVCAPGRRFCTAGAFTGECVGDITPAAETCDGKDNDCDGTPDDQAACASGYQCNGGVCVPAVCGTEQPCPEGYACQGASGCQRATGACGESAPGAGDGTTCEDGQTCRYGSCADPCDGVTCGEGAVCASGACVGGACYFTGCPDGQLCLDGACQADPCGGVNCPSGTFCREGYCVQACTFVTCKAGERCGEDGFCVADPCAGKTCAPGSRCEAGLCVEDLCAGLGCGAGQVCQGGVCVDDPCVGVKCPAGACNAGQCYPLGNPSGAGGGGTAKAKGASGGCGCGAGAGIDPAGALLALLALPLARRRAARRGGAGRGTLLVLAIAALAAASGCREEKKKFDPASCAAACEGVNHCVDLQTDALNCGICGQTCGDGNRCVDAVCGPATAVAPRVGSFSPPAVSLGSPEPQPLTVNGERFQAGAKLRAVTASGVVLVDTTFVSSTQVTAALDLEEEPPTTWSVRVLNPDNVISNAGPLEVVVPSPQITAVAPPQVTAGTSASLVVTGTGLGTSSQCHLSGPQLVDTALPSAPGATAGTLACTLDAKLLPPGSYQVWVVNNGSSALTSSKLPLLLVSPQPVLTALSPSSGESGTILPVTLFGTGFDQTSEALFDGSPVGTTYLGPTLLLVAQLQLPICGGGGSCDHSIVVRNGGDGSTNVSNALVMKAGAEPPTVSGISPATGYQGTNVPITLSGSGFPDGAFLEAAPPAGAFSALGSPSDNCPATCTTVSGTLDLHGKPEGAWLVRAVYPDDTTSPTFSFRVLSNQAVLIDAAPRGGAQGATVSVTLTVSNLQAPLSGVQVVFGGVAQAPSATPVGNTVDAQLVLSNRNTGTTTVAVRNPNGASDSNALTFNVTPGKPQVTGFTPTSATRSDTPVTVTISGHNFAKPDALGNGGSTVHISNPDLGITDHAISRAATTVVNHDQIRILLDTREALPGSYSVWVWNPGGDPPPQISDAFATKFVVQ